MDMRSFGDALEKKYKILQQNADSETTRANAVAQNVGQQQALQQQSDQAAQARAETVANNQAMIAGMNNQSSQDIAGLNNQGANYRTSLATGTQMNIAGMENALGQRRLDQQGQQFGQTLDFDRDKLDRTLALDTQKAQEDSYLKRLDLARPLAGSLDLSSPPNVGIQSPWGAPTAKPATPQSPSPLTSMPDAQLLALKGQADRAQVMTPPTSPAPVASSDPSNPRNGLFGDQGRTPTTASAPSLAVPTMSPPANPRAAVTSGPSTFDRVTSALIPPSDSAGMTAVRDIGSGLSAAGNAIGLNRNWAQGFKSFLGGETPEQVRARRAAAAGQ